MKLILLAETASFKIVCKTDFVFFTSFREPIDNLTPEERDARTVFCMQLAARIRPRDLEEFFSTVGKVIMSCVEKLSVWQKKKTFKQTQN